MKPIRSVAGLALLLALGACGSYSLYYRDGAEVSRAKADELACETAAYQQAPVRIERDIDYGDVIALPPVCSPDGSCRPGGYRRLPPRVYTYDANAGLRATVERQCMAERGYERVSLPVCSEQVASQVQPGITRVLPARASGTCVIRRGGDQYQIVQTTPG